MSDRVELPVSAPRSARIRASSTCVRRERPEALPQTMRADVAASAAAQVPHGTTVLGLKYADGVIVAGDRRATAGYTIADDKMRKVFAADDYSAIAIAGAAGMAVEMVKLFQLELEHYEKLTGDRLSLEGKANRLAQMIRAELPARDAGPRRGAAVRRLRPAPRARDGSSTTTPPAVAGKRTTTRRPVRAASRRRTR